MLTPRFCTSNHRLASHEIGLRGFFRTSRTRGVPKIEEDEKEARKVQGMDPVRRVQHPMHIAISSPIFASAPSVITITKFSARERLGVFFDEGEEVESLAEDVVAKDRLKFRDVKRYPDRLKEPRNQPVNPRLVSFKLIAQGAKGSGCGVRVSLPRREHGRSSRRTFRPSCQTMR